MLSLLCYVSGFGVLWLCVNSVFGEEFSSCPFYCQCARQSINCSNLELFKLPNDLPSWVTSLDMTSNQLNSATLDFSKQLSQLTNLIELKLNKNALTIIPINHTLRSLTKLVVAHNRLVESSLKVLEKLPNLQELDLKSNLLSHLNVGLAPNSTHLRVLNLNNNKISLMEKGSLDPLSKLTDLNLARNNLRNLNKEVFKNLTALKALDLSRNRFFKVEGLSFNGLKALTTLKMKFSSIQTLEDGAFFGLDTLTTLYLDSNSISEVTKGWLFGLNSLQLLSLSSNKIQSIDSVWEFCSQLQELDISNNLLRSIENNTLQYLSKLQTLNLNHNQISYIAEGAFNHTPSLIQLNLSSNKISWTIEDMLGPFVGLKVLTKLNLADNAITSVSEQALVGLDNLEYLDLSNNHIKTLHEASLNYSPLLQELRLDSSALVCDCHLAWLTTYLRQHHLHATQMRCAYPSHLANHSLTSLQPHQFQCSPDDFPKPVILEEPRSQVALSGSSVKLGCKAVSSSDSVMVFKWRRNNRDMAEPVLRSVSDSDSHTHISQLLLTNLSLDASALYQCIVSNDFGTVYSRKANLSVYTFPQLLKTPSNVTTKSGSMARLECSASGHPSPQIGWQKDGGTDFPAAQERRVHVMPTDDVFFIVNVKPVDSGVYSCTAQNIAGTVVANATLTVVEPPWFVKKMEDKEVRAGEAVVLECMAGGSPKPCLRWTKDGRPLHLTDRHFFTAEDQLLIIMDTQLTDEGVYSCELTNTLGSERGQVTLTVLPVYDSSASEEDMTGVIIITVVCCAVGTSIVWVIIIYQTRKRLNSPPPLPPVHLDNKSEHSSSSKDSGTGDSTKRSHEDLLLESVSCVHQEGEQPTAPEVTLPLLTSFHPHPYTDTTPPPTATAVYKVPCCCDGGSSPHPRTDHDRQPGYLCVPVYLPPHSPSSS
ncbi:leucine-rich repeats and immunoglobulin-like domains protein 3 [Macrosteles quadrilineatus]|uniref:leucine-rich repeats and immunoglobulin-like domains protein 3 n=1 Tax=Macrosteles quadrilineatus TaxID=74068 RepID=UPI0023E14C16|nr:leucine-rich repeats and immunoglobulin-like domains protein 3 [Macrosteles quadrilineatus]XP_054291073.1 leucine-rich repeats and immunoglobulin-like domains protein 3 [Macrosteles quadrilineatus]